MKNFLVVQHTYAEFLGLLEKPLEHRAIGFSYARPFTGEQLPGAAARFDAMFLLGGAHPVTDREACPWIEAELSLIAAFRRARRPVVGIGFGALLLAVQAGGEASAMPRHTAGFARARATAAGRDDPLGAALDGQEALVMYDGAATLPPGIEALAVDSEGRWLAAKMDDLTYGLLARPELKPGMIEDMIMEEDRPVPEHIGELLQQARERWDAMQALSGRVLAGLVTALDLMEERRKPPVIGLSVVRE